MNEVVVLMKGTLDGARHGQKQEINHIQVVEVIKTIELIQTIILKQKDQGTAVEQEENLVGRGPHQQVLTADVGTIMMKVIIIVTIQTEGAGVATTQAAAIDGIGMMTEMTIVTMMIEVDEPVMIAEIEMRVDRGADETA